MMSDLKRSEAMSAAAKERATTGPVHVGGQTPCLGTVCSVLALLSGATSGPEVVQTEKGLWCVSGLHTGETSPNYLFQAKRKP
ncbi:hypothetical protein GN956_G14056 [Arapaima gigas]